jgi:peptidyl-prolyl cis-trans isomerase C
MSMNKQTPFHGLADPLRRLSHVVLATGLLTAAAAQAQPTVLLQGPAATVTADDVRAAAQSVPAASRDALMSRADQVQRLLQDLYVRRALAAEAERAALDKDPVLAAQLRQARERILSEARLEAIDSAAAPADAAVAAYARDLYRASPEKFQAPAQTRARHILISRSADGKAKERAEALLAQIKGGASFDELARRESADLASARKGGDLGWFGAGTTLKEFEDAVALLKEPGELAPVVESQYGFHVVRLEGRRPAGLRPFDEVRPEIEREIRDKAHTEARRAKMRELLEPLKPDAEAVEAFSNTFRKP